MSMHTIYARSADWESVGARLEALVHGPDFRVVKRTKRTLAGAAHLNGVETFVKHVNYRSWLKGIIARVCGSRARRTIRGAEFLRRIGFACPKALAAFEHRH